MTPLPPLVETFFHDRLLRQRRASPHTVASYRDTFRLLLVFANRRLGKAPSDLELEDLDAEAIGAFLDHLETERHNSPRTRNQRLAAIRSFFKYVAFQEPAHSALIQRVLAIPPKRCDHKLVTFLTEPEIEALLQAPDRTTWIGRRDHLLMLLAIQTGLRVSEIAGLCTDQVVLGSGAHTRCQGKGRRERITPLGPKLASMIRAWFRERDVDASAHIFPSCRGGQISRDAIERLVTKHAATAESTCPSLRDKRVTPHVLRHTTAVRMLRATHDLATVALVLGHQCIDTTLIYVDADLSIKERAIARTAPPHVGRRRYQPPEPLLTFLANL